MYKIYTRPILGIESALLEVFDSTTMNAKAQIPQVTEAVTTVEFCSGLFCFCLSFLKGAAAKWPFFLKNLILILNFHLVQNTLIYGIL